MITMNPDTLQDQAGMERAFTQYFEDVKNQCSGTLNPMLDAHLLSCSRTEQTLTVWAEPQPWMANPGGILHGGIIAAYMDMIMGLLCRYCSGGDMPVSIHVDVDYLRAVPIRGRICVEARINRIGASLCFAEARVWSADRPERLLATAGGTYSIGTGKALKESAPAVLSHPE